MNAFVADLYGLCMLSAHIETVTPLRLPFSQNVVGVHIVSFYSNNYY